MSPIVSVALEVAAPSDKGSYSPVPGENSGSRHVSDVPYCECSTRGGSTERVTQGARVLAYVANRGARDLQKVLLSYTADLKTQHTHPLESMAHEL